MVTLPENGDDESGHATCSVTAILVSYNTRDLIGGAIDSLLTQDPPPERIIVIDNASSDGSAEHVEHEYGGRTDVIIIESGGNIGFARAVNVAASHVESDALLLFNPDARLQPGSLAALVEAAKRCPDARLLGPAVDFPDGRINPTTARRRPTLWTIACQAFLLSHLAPGSAWFDREPLGRDRSRERIVDMLSGVCILIDRPMWERLDGFDERFWLYGEDADLSHRAVDLGARPRFVPTARVTHAAGSSSSSSAQKLTWMRCGEVTHLRIHWSGLRLRLALGLMWSGVAVRALAAKLGLDRSGTDWPGLFAARRRWLAGFGPGPHDGPPC